MNPSPANEGVFSSSETVLTLFLFATGLLLFLAGRALVSLLTDPRAPDASHPLASPNFAAIGAGAGLTLLLTWAQRVIDVYAFWPMIGCLCLVVLAGVAFRSGYRDLICRPWRYAGWLLIVYALLAGVFLFLLRPYESFDLFKDSSMYLTQGFELLLPGVNPSEVFQFGAKISLPLLYSTPAIAAVFALFSYPDHFFYFSIGEYLVNGFVGATIPIGAYLLFRRFLPWWAALAAAILFCNVTIHIKVWSLRGESLAWIVGFGLLLVQADLQTHLRRNAIDARAAGAAVLMAILYFTLCLTHGVTALIVTLMSAGTATPFLWELFKQRKVRPLGRSLALLGLFAGLSLGLTLGFDITYSRNAQILEDNTRPPAGDIDAAIEYDNAVLNLPLETDAPRVLVAPPYVALGEMAQISALLPPASLFHRGIMWFGLREFPALARQNLQRISALERSAYAVLFALSCLLYLRYPSQRDRRHVDLFWAAATVYLLLIAFALYLDLKSVSLFPVSAVRRTFPYQAFFYWTVAALALADFVVIPAMASLRRGAFWRGRAPGSVEFGPGPVARPAFAKKALLEPIAAICFIPMWLFYSINAYYGRPASLAWIAQRAQLCLNNDCSGRSTPPLEVSLTPLFEVMQVVRDHTNVGDWVFSNIPSESQFWFLTDGRHSLLDGGSIFQLYHVQKAAARRIDQISKFAETADPKYVAGYPFNLIVLYKSAALGTLLSYGNLPVVATDMPAFAASPQFEKVWENEYYAIYRRRSGQTAVAAPDPEVPRNPVGAEQHQRD